MEKTTVYLPAELKAAVKRAARVRSMSEAEVIRAAIRAAVSAPPRQPRGALFHSDEQLSTRVDELLKGFGQQ